MEQAASSHGSQPFPRHPDGPIIQPPTHFSDESLVRYARMSGDPGDLFLYVTVRDDHPGQSPVYVDLRLDITSDTKTEIMQSRRPLVLEPVRQSLISTCLPTRCHAACLPHIHCSIDLPLHLCLLSLSLLCSVSDRSAEHT